MRLRVGRIHELPRKEAARDLLCQLLRAGDGALHALRAFRQNQLRAVGLHELAALDGHAVRHDDDNAVAPCRRDGGKADAGIAGGRLNDDGTLLQKALLLRVVDHGLCDAVLDRTGGIEILQLGKDLDLQAEFLFNMCKLQKRRSADKLICGRINFRHNNFSSISYEIGFICDLRTLRSGCDSGRWHRCRRGSDVSSAFRLHLTTVSIGLLCYSALPAVCQLFFSSHPLTGTTRVFPQIYSRYFRFFCAAHRISHLL